MRNWLLAFRYFDLLILGSSILLLFLGLLMIYSTTFESGHALFFRQMIFAAGGLLGLFAMAFFDYRNLKKITGLLYVVMVLSLVLVWWLGPDIRGSTRWIDFGFFRFQPAEFAKLAMVIITAKFLDQQGERIKNFRYVLLSLVYVAIPVVLILIEPDLGSAMVVFLTWFAMLLFSGINKKHLLILLAIFLVIAVAAWFFVLHDYQRERVYTFLDPYKDPQGTGYNVLQSIIAVGSGEYFGRGVGRGLQSQLKFLPERQTDFIFASTAEELGFVGSMLILGLFFLLLFRINRALNAARDNFGTFLGLGIFFMILFQVIVNVGMNLGLMPVTGIPLPLVSYGGSSLVITLLSLGLVESVVAKQKVIRFG